MVWTYCERYTAAPLAKWHIRQTEERLLGGGVKEALCGSFSVNGWDVDLDVNERNVEFACVACARAWKKANGISTEIGP